VGSILTHSEPTRGIPRWCLQLPFVPYNRAEFPKLVAFVYPLWNFRLTVLKYYLGLERCAQQVAPLISHQSMYSRWNEVTRIPMHRSQIC